MTCSGLLLQARCAWLVAGAIFASAPVVSLAQSAWPAKTVRIIVPFAPGGSSDVVARQLALHLSAVLGQPFVVENRAGAGGNTGTDAVAKAAPDGYTIGISTSGPLANNPSLYKSMPYDPQKDLTPIALVGEIPLVIVVNPAVKATTLKEFAAESNANLGASTGRFSVGHPGNGTIGHLALESFKTMTGANLQGVPYKGDTPAMTDVLGGQVQAVAAPVTAFIPHIQSKKLRALAVTSKTRFAGLPDVPTALEQGVNLDATVWSAAIGPAGLPQPIVTRLNQEINKYLGSTEGRAKLAQFGMVEGSGAPDLLGKMMSAEAAKWKKVVEAARISLE